MYTKHYGFVKKPFEVSPDLEFLYPTPSIQELVAALIYGIRERRGFIVVVGDVGTGKTLLANAAVQRLDRDTKVAFLFTSYLPFKQLLSMALVELELAEPEEKYNTFEAIHRLQTYAKEQQARNGNVALIIDEAQNLSHKTMEHLRMLSNLETPNQKLVQIVLVGQPELDEKLDRHDWRQLVQRISVKRYSTALPEEDTYKYIDHRLSIAQYNGASLFTQNALKKVWRASEGIPRKINILCDNALLLGYALDQKKIGRKIIEEAIQDLSWNDSGVAPKTRFDESKADSIIKRIWKVFRTAIGFG